MKRNRWPWTCKFLGLVFANNEAGDGIDDECMKDMGEHYDDCGVAEEYIGVAWVNSRYHSKNRTC